MEVLLDQLNGGCHLLTAGQASSRRHRNSLPLRYCRGKFKVIKLIMTMERNGLNYRMFMITCLAVGSILEG